MVFYSPELDEIMLMTVGKMQFEFERIDFQFWWESSIHRGEEERNKYAWYFLGTI